VTWVLTIAAVWTAVAFTICAVLLLLVRRHLVGSRTTSVPDPLTILDPRGTDERPRTPA
jgi:hypothetical protein